MARQQRSNNSTFSQESNRPIARVAIYARVLTGSAGLGGGSFGFDPFLVMSCYTHEVPHDAPITVCYFSSLNGAWVPVNNGPTATIGPPRQQYKPAQTGLTKYLTQYVPCAVGEGINRFWGRNANVPGSSGSNATVTVAVNIAPIVATLNTGSYMKGGPFLFLGVAAYWDIGNALAVRQTCTQSVYGGG